MASDINRERVYLPDWLVDYAKEVCGSIVLSEEPGNKIRRYREKIYLTQEDVGDILGIARETVSRIENNKTKPSFEFVKGFTSIIAVSEVFKIFLARKELSEDFIDIPYIERISLEFDISRKYFEKIALSTLNSYDRKKKKALKNLEGV